MLSVTEEAVPLEENLPTNTSCVNWNQYYSKCEQRGLNPFQGTISFDNIGMAWVAIFLVSYTYATIHTSNNQKKSKDDNRRLIYV